MDVDNPQIEDKKIVAEIWYIKHKSLLRRLVLGLIIAVDAALVLYSGFGIGKDIFSFTDRKQQDFELIKTQIPSGLKAKPNDLLLGSVDLVRVGDAVDVLARVQNPNEDWMVRFEYVIGIGETIERGVDGFLLPGEERPLFSSFKNSGGTLVFNIENVSWKRVNNKEIPNYPEWRDQRISFEVKNAVYAPAEVEGGVSRSDIELVNNSAFGYFEPKFLILLYRNTRLVGIQSVIIDKFEPGQTREAEVSWLGRIGGVSRVEVVPVIDIFDPEAYIKK